MNEMQRQAYLQSLGFTPWVARQPLPGAAPTPVLEPQQAPVPEPAAVVPDQRRQAPAAPAAAAETAAPVPASASVRTPAPVPDTPATAEAPLCMHACPLGDVLVLVEQQPADAPDLGRDARELLANLVRAFGRQEQRRRRFDWPMAHVNDGTLEDFLVQFCQSLAPQQVVLCAGEDTCQRLMAGERYQPREHHGLRWLAISSLQEMLADPVAHKRRSWEAIKQAGLHKAPAP